MNYLPRASFILWSSWSLPPEQLRITAVSHWHPAQKYILITFLLVITAFCLRHSINTVSSFSILEAMPPNCSAKGTSDISIAQSSGPFSVLVWIGVTSSSSHCWSLQPRNIFISQFPGHHIFLIFFLPYLLALLAFCWYSSFLHLSVPKSFLYLDEKSLMWAPTVGHLPSKHKAQVQTPELPKQTMKSFMVSSPDVYALSPLPH
jgi:hypothetical protein